MKKILVILSLFTLQYSIQAQTQYEMNMESQKEYKKVDAELGRIYNKIIKIYGDDPDFIQKLRISERLWIKLRDANMELRFSQGGRDAYGSSFPLSYNQHIIKLTKERTEFLKEWLEGDYFQCSSSIRFGH